MAFFNQFQRGVDLAKFKANQLNRVNKLQNEIANNTGEIQNIRKEIVDTVLLLYRSNSEMPTQLVQLCTQVAELEGKIKDLENTITSIRSENFDPGTAVAPIAGNEGKFCPHCKKEVPINSEFCIHCGKKI